MKYVKADYMVGKLSQILGADKNIRGGE